MADNTELRTRLGLLGPTELLEKLASVSVDADRPVAWADPLVQVHMKSGASLRGHLLSAGSRAGGEGSHFVLKLEPKSDAHLARDVTFIDGSQIEAVVLFDVDVLLEAMPGQSLL